MPAILNVDTSVRGYSLPKPYGKEFVVLHKPDYKHDWHAIGIYRLDNPGVIALPQCHHLETKVLLYYQ